MEKIPERDTPATLDDLVGRVDSELESEWQKRLRAELAGQDRAWLEEQLVQSVLRERALREAPHRSLSRQAHHVESREQRRERLERIRQLDLDTIALGRTIEDYSARNRQNLVADGLLLDPPHKGKEALGEAHRSRAGQDLLQQAKDVFYALLFGDEKVGVRLPRANRDFLTVTLPTAKKAALESFMLAVTETRVDGTWLDPEGVSDDIGASNTILQVEYGDGPDHLVSDALIAVIRLINELEVNEEILYARIECLERSTLV